MASRNRTPMPPHPEDEELEMEEEDEDEEMDEGMDMFEALGSLLATEEGETVATSLVGLKDATEKIALGLEFQNKILMKILTAITTKQPPVPATPSA